MDREAAATLMQIGQIGQIVVLVLLLPTLARVFGPRLLAWLVARRPGRARLVLPAKDAPERARTAVRLAEGQRWLIVGASGSGKSTAARGLIRAYLAEGAEVIVLDPEGASWPKGARMIGAPDDFESIAVELANVAQAATARRAAFTRGDRAFEPLLVVIEEAPAILRHTVGAVEILNDLARRGRKIGIHVLLLSQDTQARTLKLEGQLQVLTNFRRLESRLVAGGVALVEGDRQTAMIPFDDGQDLVPPEPTPDADRLLTTLHTNWYGSTKAHQIGPMQAVSEPVREPVRSGTADTDAVNAGTAVRAPVPPANRITDDQLIAELVARGVSANQIAAVVGGTRAVILDKVGALRASGG